MVTGEGESSTGPEGETFKGSLRSGLGILNGFNPNGLTRLLLCLRVKLPLKSIVVLYECEYTKIL